MVKDGANCPAVPVWKAAKVTPSDYFSPEMRLTPI
jgi:hypothetical protein